jgi:D-erythrulose 4-kinase
VSYLFNDAPDFASEAIEGFVDLHRDIVRTVAGGVARRTGTASGQVAVVTGGGSGHYPAVAGYVGTGLAHGAALGNVFASPSVQQIHSVARSVENGGGVLLAYWNYAGDMLSFEGARERLEADGIACLSVRVTDDIASARPAHRDQRRGIAGGLVVYKVAAAAAERGDDLTAVHAIAERANARTRTLGVAFTGATLPGASGPMFTLPEGRMGVGIGIHGEPGLTISHTTSSAALAAEMLDRLFAERPVEGRDRVALIVNGLGSVKLEELFVFYRDLKRVAVRRGVEVVTADVGEFVTSFEMGGLSVTLVWLDDELEDLWCRPCYTPAIRRGNVVVSGERLDDEIPVEEFAPVAHPGSTESAAAARALVPVMRAIAAVIDENVTELGRLDMIAGDGDHGIGMRRGAVAALAAIEREIVHDPGLGSLLRLAGASWADHAGGTSGMLWGVMLDTVGGIFGDESIPDVADIARAATAAVDAVCAVGGARPGDKTLVDAMLPFRDALIQASEDGLPLGTALSRASERTNAAAFATADLIPRLGRARTHGDRSRGYPDPGATSFAMIVSAVTDSIITGARTP